MKLEVISGKKNNWSSVAGSVMVTAAAILKKRNKMNYELVDDIYWIGLNMFAISCGDKIIFKKKN